jgi:hypothetical protein
MFTETQWLFPLVWAGLYTSDYCFTIACARLYQAQSTIVFEGSYEITPAFQRDVNALRRISPRFVAILVASTAYVWLLARVSSAWETHDVFALAIGALVLIQLTVHLRHLRNWFLLRAVHRGSITGHIDYRRGVVLRGSAFELLTFSALYACLFVVTRNPFVLGGAIACSVLSINHYWLARRHDVSRAGAENKAAHAANAHPS